MASTTSITPLPSCHPFPPLWQGAAQSTPPTSFFILSLHQVFTKHQFTITSCLSLRLCPFPFNTINLYPNFGGRSPTTVHGPLGPLTSSMPCPMSVFRSCMLWFYKRKGKKKVHVLPSACQLRTVATERPVWRCLSSVMYILGGAAGSVHSLYTLVWSGSRLTDDFEL